jgi:arylsulfatase/uncharacterized sulfatase
MRPVAARLTVLLAALLGAGVPGPPAVAETRPNIVLIVADDLGFSDLGAFGGEIATPNLDALAQAGVRFSNFHVSGSCSPTRAMLLTGVASHVAGVGNLLESMPFEHRGRPGYLGSLDTGVVSVATVLRDAGYRTIASGKWNVGTEPHNLPPQRGFDRSLVQGDTGSDNWVPSQRYLPMAARVLWFEDGREAPMPQRFYSSAYFTDRAIGFLREGERSGRPFFLLLGYQANHVPVQAPREFIDRYRGRYDAGWSVLREHRRDRAAALGLVPPDTRLAPQPRVADWDALSDRERRYQARLMEVYAGMAEAMDHHLGRLIAHLRETGEHERTVYLFLSDNGPEGSDYRDARPWLLTQYTRRLEALGGEGAYVVMGPSWAAASASPLSGFKFYAGEGGIRVPLIVAGVPGAAAGAIHGGLTHVTDVVPTLLALAGATHPAHAPGAQVAAPSGRSLLPVLADPTARVRGPDEDLGYELSGNAALFRGDLKLVRNLPPFGDGTWRLYDLRRDPGETTDLRERLTQTYASMQTAWEAWAREHRVLPIPPGYDPQRAVLIHTFRAYWIPQYRAPVLVAVGVLAAAALGALWLRRRRVR